MGSQTAMAETRSRLIARCRPLVPIVLAVTIYLAFCWSLGVGTAGLQYDEAISFRGAATVLSGSQQACQWGEYFKFAGRCWPLMLAAYVGTPKDYFLLPVFGLAGVHTGVARMGAAVFAALCIIGVWLFLREVHGRKSAAIAAFALALHPAYISLPLFDNGNVAFSFAIIGMLFATAAALIRSVSRGKVFLAGLLVGIGVWGRLNFSWVVVAALVAIVLAYRRDVLRAIRYLPIFAAGTVVGALPLLLYLRKHTKDLLEFMDVAAVETTLERRLSYFMMLFRDALFAGGEHRVIWGGAQLPSWVGLLALAVVSASLIWCAVAVRTRVAYSLCIGNILLASSYAFSKLPVAEHHLVMLVPFEILLVAICCADLMDRYRAARGVVVAVASAYCLGALFCNVQAAEGLRATRGIGEWSEGITSLKAVVEQQGQRPLYELDWGIHEPLDLLSKGRVSGTELYFGASAAKAGDGRTWADVARAGGVFVTYGNPYLHFPLSTLSFRQALRCVHTPYRTLTVPDRQDSTYAFVYVLEPEQSQASHTTPEACSASPAESFLADPNPITVRDGTGKGGTTLFFSTTASKYVEIHVEKPDGPLFSRFSSISEVNSGAATTGKWVSNGMKFYLQDVSRGRALSAENTLATVSVRVNATPPGSPSVR